MRKPRIEISYRRNLDVKIPSQPGRPPFVFAASGLIVGRNRFFVVADDENSMASFPLTDTGPGNFHSLFSGDLPLTHQERKKLKPDLESLCWVQAFGQGNPALLALPSGSKANRTRGAWIELGFDEVPSIISELELKELYASFPFRELNLEGCVVCGQDLILLQRGNSQFQENAVALLDADNFIRHVHEGRTLSSDLIKSVHSIELGTMDGTALTFTDMTLGPENDIYFLAAAEKTESSYDDGPFQGAVLGRLELPNKVLWMEILSISSKPEGLAWLPGSGTDQFLIVTDADSQTEPSQLYEARLHWD